MPEDSLASCDSVEPVKSSSKGVAKLSYDCERNTSSTWCKATRWKISSLRQMLNIQGNQPLF